MYRDLNIKYIRAILHLCYVLATRQQSQRLQRMRVLAQTCTFAVLIFTSGDMLFPKKQPNDILDTSPRPNNGES
jgi:hypothetical protein